MHRLSLGLSLGLALGLTVAVLAASPAAADRARQVRYIGIHPVAKATGGGTCYIEGPHVHPYAADKLQYRDHRGHHFFVGDPVAYGYDGPKHAYKGHHPIQVDAVVHADAPDLEFCYLDGAHYHAFAPPPGRDFQRVGEVAFYVGTPPPVYVEARPALIQINAHYRPLSYARPVVTVDAPAGWIGARVDLVRPVVVAPRASARVDVVIPMPSVRIDVGVRSPVIIHGHHKHKKHKKHKHWR